MIESIEKLREWSRLFDDMYVMEEGDICHIYNRPLTDSMKSWGELMREQCGEIEREIAERYMLKPDAEIDKTAVQEYNLDVQVVAEPKIEYTAELRHRCGATTSISVAFRLE